MVSIDNIRVRNWCFTLNNYTPEEEEGLKSWAIANVDYLVFGREVGEEKGTPHLQGYVEFANAHRGSALKKLFRGRISWRPRKGTAYQASMYCKKGTQLHAEWVSQKELGPNFGKDAVLFEHGTISNQGKRNDLADVGQAVLAGETMKDIATEYPSTFIKYHKGIFAMRSAIKGIFDFEDRTTKPKVIWRWGATGVGKSRTAREAHKSFYIKDGTPWWDGYEQQEAIIIDDFDGKWPFRDLLRLLDFGPYQGQFKGGYVKINSPFIYITCEFPPELAFANATGDISQVLRRIDQVIHVEAQPS
nr:putative replication associated protein [Crucivirus sp.]